MSEQDAMIEKPKVRRWRLWPRWPKNDYQRVEMLRKGLRWDKPLPFVMSAFGLFCIGAGLYWYLSRWSVITAGDLDPKVARALRAYLDGGLNAGMLATAGVYFFIVTSLTLAITRKQRKLLIKYHDRLIELGEFPEADQGEAVMAGEENENARQD